MSKRIVCNLEFALLPLSVLLCEEEQLKPGNFGVYSQEMHLNTKILI